MVAVNDLAVEFSGHTLFKNVSFVINPTDKIALMGKNGAGKSTIMKIIAGKQKANKGHVQRPPDSIIAYLPQHLLLDDNSTVFEETSKAFGQVMEMKAEMEKLNKELETRTDYESKEYMDIINKVTDLGEVFYALEDVNYDAEVEKTLLGLGFKREDFHQPTSNFSGGWRMRIELAKILLQKPDLILLDEPTNHIDIESVMWLEDFLLNKAKAVVVISHDKAFIDNITNRTIELTMGRIYDYKANYTHYLQLREERRSHQLKAYKEQQKLIADSKRFIERFRGTYSKANQVNSTERMLEKLEIIEVDEVDNSALKLRFPPCVRSGDYPVIVKDLSKSYDDHIVFQDASFTIERGEKVSFVGRNGEGKSTMIKAIMDEIEFNGACKIGHNIQIGYFAQNQASLLDPELTVFETVDNIATGDIRTQLKNTLILVSHDRAFLQGLSQKVFEFKDKRVIEHFETIDDFLERNKIENLKEIDLLKK